MLKHATATLTQIGRIRHFDHLAAMAQTYLDVPAVLIVGEGEVPTVLGRAGKGFEPPRAVVLAAVQVGVHRPAEASEHLRVPGELIEGEGGVNRIIKLSLSEEPRLSCLLFPKLIGTKAGNLARFETTARRLIAEHGLLQRYRTDLRRYISMFDQMERTAQVGVWEQRPDSDTLFFSDEVCRIFDRPVGTEPRLDEALSHFPEPTRSEVADALEETRQTGVPCDLVVPLTPSANAKKMVRLVASVQHPPEGGERLAGILQDVTQQHAATEKLWWMANHDPLTRLPNRALFNDRVQKALQRRARTHKILCLVLIDVNRFKEVNDTLGHAAGDELLRRVAAQLTETVRSNDTVARTGGDEFSILVEDLDNEDALQRVFARLRGALQVDLPWGEGTTRVSLSAGAALAPTHGLDQDALTSLADLALYRMKKERAGELALYEPSFGHAAAARDSLLSDAKRALDMGDFVPFYQPQVDVGTGRIVGVEALARWIRPHGVASAAEFAFALQDAGLGPKIGEAILARAVEDLAAINARRANKVVLALNASSQELVSEDYLGRLRAHLAAHGPTPFPVVVELSEATLVDDLTGELAALLKAAKRDGLAFALDDLGTGYASLVQMATLPIDELKIDRRFVAGLTTDRADGRIVKGMVDLARSLGLRVVAEGIETAGQARAFAALGGQDAQGHLYSEAVCIETLQSLLGGGHSRTRARVA